MVTCNLAASSGWRAIDSMVFETTRPTPMPGPTAAKTANIEAEQAAARAEASQIREEARAEAAAIGAEIKETAQAEAARLLAAAKSQIDAETQAALVALRAEVGSLAVDLASSVVGESLKNDKLAANVVDSFLAELETKKK